MRKPARRRTVVIVLLLLVVGATVAGVSMWPEEKQASVGAPNIILISIDSLRADHLGCYGYHRATSPNIDALAQRGTLFRNCTSESSWTVPSHATMLTGLPQKIHGVRSKTTRIASEIPTLATRLRLAGYQTKGVVTAPTVDVMYGFDQGFDDYDNALPFPAKPPKNKKQANEFYLRVIQGVHAEQTTDRAIEWLEKQRKRNGKPFFLFVHYWDVHRDYNPPAPYDTQFDPDYKGGMDFSMVRQNKMIQPWMDPRDLEHLIALYDGEIAYTDANIGRLMDWIETSDAGDRTVIVLTADHGEEFFEHGKKGHANSLYQETVHVPLIISRPGQRDQRFVDTPVGTLDIAPTMLELAGLSSDLPGRDLLAEELSEEPVLSQLFTGRSSIRAGPLKAHLFHGKQRWELYDLSSDSGEKDDLAARRPKELEKLKSLFEHRLWEYRIYREEHFSGSSPHNPSLRDVTAAMRTLGYMR